MSSDRSLVRSAAWLFTVAGVVTLVSSRLPSGGVRSVNVMDATGLASILAGIAVWLLPWERWHPRASLGLVGLALGLIAFDDAFGASSPYTYAVYFVVVFAWVGLCHPRRTSLYLAPATVPFYVLPFVLDSSGGAGGFASVAVTIPVGVLIGETVAWAMAQVERSRAEAEHNARMLRALVRGTTTITALDGDQVLAGVVDSAMGLGMESAWLAVFDETATSWTMTHARGLAAALAGHAYPNSWGLTGLVRTRRAPVLITDGTRDDAGADTDFPELAGAGSVTACPVWVHGRLAAVLGAASVRRSITAEDAEAVGLLAVHAGRTLENAELYREERRAREQLAVVSVRDELTGVGNRRHAVALLGALQPGDAVVMIDLDHFKKVNDTEGHSAGDEVLQALADHLGRGVRDADVVARYGGEEFLVVLRGAGTEGVVTAERLRATWRETSPRTTFSAGVAVHLAGQPGTATLAQADAALYAAKRMGRNRVCENLVELAV
jgi:diguanylate cyclase (GGDEF)-like protein